jgi:hypothetical protein
VERVVVWYYDNEDASSKNVSEKVNEHGHRGRDLN